MDDKGGRETADREAQNRARRQTDGDDTKPISSIENRDRTVKDRARSGSGPAVRPGASSGVGGNLLEKSDLSNVRDLTPSASQEPAPAGECGVKIIAIAVEEENEQLKKQQTEIDHLKKTLTQNTNENKEALQEDKKESTSSRKKCIYLVIALLLIGGGVAGYLLGTGGKDVVEPVSRSQSDPTSAPIAPPTKFQQFDPPSKKDCAAIASGNEIDNQDLFASSNFALELDVTLETGVDDETIYLPVLEDALQAIWLPEVAGCDRGVTRHRHLREDRKLQIKEYVVANGLVLSLAPPSSGGCQGDASSRASCVRVVVTMDLWLREKVESFIPLLGHMATTLGDDPVERMNLEAYFVSIVIVNGYPTQPTDEPRPSTTNLPAQNETTQSPTKKPTVAPTVAGSPTAMPSLITPSAEASMSSEYWCNQAICDDAGQLAVPLGGPEKAIDLNTDGVYLNDSSTQTWLEYNPWWRVDYCVPKNVAKVVVWNRVDTDYKENIIGCDVQLLDENFLALATSPITSSDPFTEHDFGFVSGVKYVRVMQLKSDKWYYLSLAEVQVFGPAGEDWHAIDACRYAYQPSNLYCALTCTDQGWSLPASGARKAIDGNTGITWGDGLAHSAWQINPWWTVTLGFTATVHRVKIWNRNDFQENMIGTFLEIFKADSDGVWETGFSQEITTAAADYEFEFPDGIEGAVSIRLMKKNSVLAFVYFAELEVFGYRTS